MLPGKYLVNLSKTRLKSLKLSQKLTSLGLRKFHIILNPKMKTINQDPHF